MTDSRLQKCVMFYQELLVVLYSTSFAILLLIYTSKCSWLREHSDFLARTVHIAPDSGNSFEKREADTQASPCPVRSCHTRLLRAFVGAVSTLASQLLLWPNRGPELPATYEVVEDRCSGSITMK